MTMRTYNKEQSTFIMNELAKNTKVKVVMNIVLFLLVVVLFLSPVFLKVSDSSYFTSLVFNFKKLMSAPYFLTPLCIVLMYWILRLVHHVESSKH